ncbi:MAG: hypothetical protein WC926_01920 [Candidatus Paceibacterota bacterium]|jgi:hypothetical protein
MAVKNISVRRPRSKAVKKEKILKDKKTLPDKQPDAERKKSPRSWVIDVNMGYGHQRTAYPLRFLAPGEKVVSANDYDGIPDGDKIIWESSRKVYEFISRLKGVPVIGGFCFLTMDYLQKILSYYPKRDLSESNFSVDQVYRLLKGGWGRDLVSKLTKKHPGIPFITTFFNVAFMAEFFGYPGDIYCVICDADIARAWAPLNPYMTRIKYFAPNQRVVQRLESYGVNRSNIILTGYPLPVENIGGEKMEILKEDLRYRLLNLDPDGRYQENYKALVENHLGQLPRQSGRPLTIMFSVGGAGAQKEMGVEILKSLKEKIIFGSVKMILSVGVRESISEYFVEEIKKIGLENELERNIEIIFRRSVPEYFDGFNKALRETDILWTKPSELSFYSALGLPIIIAPPIGSQENFNQRWILKSGFGINQENPAYTSQWLFDWLSQGYLAEAAMQAFIEGEQLGALRINKEIEK